MCFSKFERTVSECRMESSVRTPRGSIAFECEAFAILTTDRFVPKVVVTLEASKFVREAFIWFVIATEPPAGSWYGGRHPICGRRLSPSLLLSWVTVPQMALSIPLREWRTLRHSRSRLLRSPDWAVYPRPDLIADCPVVSLRDSDRRSNQVSSHD